MSKIQYGSQAIIKCPGLSLHTYLLLITAFTALIIFSSGCETPLNMDSKGSVDIPVELNRTIGSLANIYQSGAIPVRGWGLVAGLNGTGSSECPPDLRRQLHRLIQQQSGMSATAADNFINSNNTAIVDIFGKIPAVATKGENFDLKVFAIANTQTSSLDGGTLYTTQLKERSRIRQYDQFVKTLAEAQGPVYVDRFEAQQNSTPSGYVLGGGTVIEPVQIVVGLKEPNYHVASAVRNQLNQRFGPKTAHALSPSEIEVTIPQEYQGVKAKFIEMIRQSFLVSNPQIEQQRIEMLINKLVTEDNKMLAELALETIGNSALYSLAPLLNSQDETVRFHAARCAISIGEDKALEVLQRFTTDKDSPYRIQAIEAIGRDGSRSRAGRALRGLVSDDDLAVRFAAYEQLLKLNDTTVSRSLIGGDFFVDSVVGAGEKIIYISRSEIPRIVLFGEPISCEQNIFLKTPDGNIIINSARDSSKIDVLRKHPDMPKLVGPVASSFKVKHLISAMGESPTAGEKRNVRPGLGIPYSEVAAVLKQMCDSGAIKAQLILGPLPDINP